MFIDHYIISKSFWDGRNKSGVELSFNKDGKKEAINRAIGDLMERTLKRRDEAKGNRDEEIRKALLPKLNEWFEKPEIKITEKEFDKWHNKACDAVLEVLQRFYTNNDYLKTPVQYGKAQKIVNMTMKGMYCLKGADAYEKHFKFCHMALDSFTLEWFKRYIARQWFNSKKERGLQIKVTTDGGSFPKWSNLNYTQNSLELTYEQYEQTPDVRLDDNKKYHYMFFVKTIRAYFDPTNKNNQYSGLTPLQAEFCIWPEMKLRMATEAFLFELDPIRYKESEAANAEKQNLRNLSVDTLIQRVKDTIKDYQFR